MTIHKCDGCGFEMNTTTISVRTEFPHYGIAELCAECAKPLIKVLKEKKILQEQLVGLSKPNENPNRL